MDVTPNGSNAGATTSYYFFGGQRVAQRDKRSGSTDTLRFLHGDHLGSQALVTDDAGNEVSRVSYLPYGGTRLGSQTGAFGFTDQRLEQQHGLHYYGNHSGYGRFYDSGIGVWTQPDIQVPGASAVDWNRFAYVRANPLRYIDPSGHACVDSTGVNFNDCVDEFGNLVEAGQQAIRNFFDWLNEKTGRASYQNGKRNDENGHFDPCRMTQGSFCLGPGQLVFDPLTGKVRWQPGGLDPDIAAEGLAGGARAAKSVLQQGGETVGQALARHAQGRSSLQNMLSRIIGADGEVIGRVGRAKDPTIRVLSGGETAAESLYSDLVRLGGGGETVQLPQNGGSLTRLSDGTVVVYRRVSSESDPAVSLSLAGVRGEIKWHFEP